MSYWTREDQPNYLFDLARINPFAIQKCTFSLSCRVQLILQRIVVESKHQFFVDNKCNRNTTYVYSVHKIRGAIDGINYPCWRIG
jgi:hypothetical protein